MIYKLGSLLLCCMYIFGNYSMQGSECFCIIVIKIQYQYYYMNINKEKWSWVPNNIISLFNLAFITLVSTARHICRESKLLADNVCTCDLNLPVGDSAAGFTAHAGAFGGGWSVDGVSETTRRFLSGMNVEVSLLDSAFSASASKRVMRQFNSAGDNYVIKCRYNTIVFLLGERQGSFLTTIVPSEPSSSSDM